MYLGCQTISYRTRDKIYLISELWGYETLLEILKSDSPYFSEWLPKSATKSQTVSFDFELPLVFNH